MAAAPRPWSNPSPILRHALPVTLDSNPSAAEVDPLLLLSNLLQAFGMKALYPASNDMSELNTTALSLKIARHSHCSGCPPGFCSGLRPPPSFRVISDTEAQLEAQLAALTEYGFEEEEEPSGYLVVCTCSHGLMDHGADESIIGRDEFIRRGRVAIRCDELLQVRP